MTFRNEVLNFDKENSDGTRIKRTKKNGIVRELKFNKTGREAWRIIQSKKDNELFSEELSQLIGFGARDVEISQSEEALLPGRLSRRVLIVSLKDNYICDLIDAEQVSTLTAKERLLLVKQLQKAVDILVQIDEKLSFFDVN